MTTFRNAVLCLVIVLVCTFSYYGAYQLGYEAGQTNPALTITGNVTIHGDIAHRGDGIGIMLKEKPSNANPLRADKMFHLEATPIDSKLIDPKIGKPAEEEAK